MSNRLTFIEIDIPKCPHTYGETPCTAQLSVTGTKKCFNCLATCQDVDNFTAVNETLRFNIPSSNQRFDLNASPNLSIPNVESVAYSPPTLALGQSIGVRASITVKFRDSRSPDTDASGDKYLADRDYDPYNQGTYWGKFRARYPFLKGQPLRWIQGTDKQNVADMETRTFVIDAVTGPDTQGLYTITAKDILKLTDGERSLAPSMHDITTGVTAITETYTGNIGVGDGKQQYLPGGYAVIGGEEIVAYEDLTADPTNSNITITARGQLDTVAKAHDTDVSIQHVLSFDGASPADIFYSLLVDFAKVDPAYIPLSDWQIEASTYINRNYSADIAQPTAVVDLINELIEQTASSMWWDNEAQLIRWQVMKKPAPGTTAYSDRNMLTGSFNIKDDYGKRVSRCLIHFGQINPLLSLTEKQNYATRVLRTELVSEKPFGDVPAYKQIYSRWIPSAGRAVAERLGDLILQRFSIPPRKVGFKLLRDSGIQPPELSGAYNAQSTMLQDDTGANSLMPIQVTGLVPNATHYQVTAEEITFNSIITPDDPNVVPVSLNVSEQNIDLRQKYEEAGGTEPNSNTVVNVIVESGIVIGSGSPNDPAIKTGVWPLGAAINLINNGFIVGAGGSAGHGASIYSDANNKTPAKILSEATDGGDGGNAIELEHDISIDNTNGIIGGGGGGGGGAGAAAVTAKWQRNTTEIYYLAALCAGSGGSGGAGSVSGNGGDSGTQERFATGFVPGYPYRYGASNSPQGGLAGSLLSGGEQATSVFQDTVLAGFEYWTVDPLEVHALTVPSKGGDLGQAGEDGSDGQASYYKHNSVSWSLWEIESLGGIGGAPGAAINSNEHTATFSNSGDIRGAIT